MEIVDDDSACSNIHRSNLLRYFYSRSRSLSLSTASMRSPSDAVIFAFSISILHVKDLHFLFPDSDSLECLLMLLNVFLEFGLGALE